MMCHPPKGYIMFGLKKLKYYGDRGPYMRARGRGTDNPNTLIFLAKLLPTVSNKSELFLEKAMSGLTQAELKCDVLHDFVPFVQFKKR